MLALPAAPASATQLHTRPCRPRHRPVCSTTHGSSSSVAAVPVQQAGEPTAVVSQILDLTAGTGAISQRGGLGVSCSLSSAEGCMLKHIVLGCCLQTVASTSLSSSVSKLTACWSSWSLWASSSSHGHWTTPCCMETTTWHTPQPQRHRANAANVRGTQLPSLWDESPHAAAQ